MAGLGKLFGIFGGGGPKPPRSTADAPVDYKEYEIRPDPLNEGGHWLTAGVIAKEFPDGVVREHAFLRGDRHASRDTAVEFTIVKARQIIDLEGDRIFEEQV